MKVQVANLSGRALDWAVAKCDEENLPFISKDGGVFCQATNNYGYYSPSTVWSQGGPLIERESIAVTPCEDMESWASAVVFRQGVETQYGPTPLIAAMRALVVAKFGSEVEIPEELL